MKIKILLLLLVSVMMFGCATKKTYHSAEAKQIFENSVKTYTLQKVIVEDEESNIPEENNCLNKNQLEQYFTKFISNKLQENELTSANPNFDVVVKLKIKRNLHAFNSKVLTDVDCEVKLTVKKGDTEIVTRKFSGESYRTFKASIGKFEENREFAYYSVITNTVIKMLQDL